MRERRQVKRPEAVDVEAETEGAGHSGGDEERRRAEKHGADPSP